MRFDSKNAYNIIQNIKMKIGIKVRFTEQI